MWWLDVTMNLTHIWHVVWWLGVTMNLTRVCHGNSILWHIPQKKEAAQLLYTQPARRAGEKRH